MPSEIELVAQVAARACAAAINTPKSMEFRRRLLDALDQMAELLVRPDGSSYPEQTSDLLRQITICVDIVRHRADSGASNVASIQYSIRELQRLLIQLSGELQNLAGA